MKPLFFKSLRGALCACVASALMLFIFTFVAMRFENPSSFVFVFSNISLLLGAFIGGRLSVGEGENKLLSGVICGAIMLILVLLASIILSELDKTSLLRMLLTVVFSVLGAFSKRSGEKAPSSAKRRKSIAKKYASYR